MTILTQSRGPIFSQLAVAIGGHAVVAATFFAALFDPAGRFDVFKASALLFTLEFLGLVGTIFAGWTTQWRLAARGNKRMPSAARTMFDRVPGAIGSIVMTLAGLPILIWFAIATILLVRLFGNVTAPLLFFIDFSAKFFGQKAAPHPRRFAFTGGAFLVAFLAAGIFEPFWRAVFPLPEAFFSRSDAPHITLVWGALYYSLLFIIEIFFVRKSTRRTSG